MEPNLKFLIITYFVALFVDWVFQRDWQAVNKSKWKKQDDKVLSLLALITHSLVYSVLTTFIILVLNVIPIKLITILIVFLTLFITHMIIDTRIPVKWIMRYIKGMTKEQINDYTTFGFIHIGIDHRLHELVILILSFII